MTQSTRDPDNPLTERRSTFRAIRSYVLREGRLTKGQQRALDQLWPQYGLVADKEVPIDLERIFSRKAPVVLEIGFGDGGALAEIAAANPDKNFIGVEVHRPGVGSLMLKLEQAEQDNVRIFCHDGVEVLKNQIPPASMERIQLFFPDPWHKKRHHKRRILSPSFIELVSNRLQQGGVFHFASDWEDYADQALERLNQCTSMRNLSQEGGYSPRPEWRPLTKFEQRGQRLGHVVRDILMEKQ